MVIPRALYSLLFWRVAAYYGILIASVFALVGVFRPDWAVYLPLGGTPGSAADSPLSDGIDLYGQVMTLGHEEVFVGNAGRLLSAMTSSLIVMIPLRWVYVATGMRKTSDPDVATGLLLLPLVITSIIFCIKFSLPLAFALIGILAGIRVRTEATNQSDTHFTFVSIGVGLAIGAGYLAIALVLACFFALTALIAAPKNTGSRTHG